MEDSRMWVGVDKQINSRGGGGGGGGGAHKQTFGWERQKLTQHFTDQRKLEFTYTDMH